MILPVNKFVAACPPKPWLIVGKGPSVDTLINIDHTAYNVLTLNHACRVVRPTLAHFVDWDAFTDCAEQLASDETPVCMPWVPHVSNKPGNQNLGQMHCLFGLDDKSIPLAWLVGVDKVFSYNSTGCQLSRCNHRLPRVRLRFFSAVAAFNLLGLSGVKEVASIGVDGGTEYAKKFSYLKPLTNGRTSFDAQTAEIDLAVRTYKMKYTKVQ